MGRLNKLSEETITVSLGKLVNKEEVYGQMSPEEQRRHDKCREFVLPHKKIQYVIDNIKILHSKRNPGKEGG